MGSDMYMYTEEKVGWLKYVDIYRYAKKNELNNIVKRIVLLID